LNRTRGYNFAGKRLSEIEALIRDRHGGPVNDTDDGEAYLSAALNAKAWIRIFLGMKQHPAPLIDWAAEWTPLVPAEHVRKLVERVCAKPRKMKAVTVGKM